ncbi:MAG: helix-turn-helix domain-containing protein [Clostridia bacterium]|nr:helix-turn-helix domain-containing protein [Clostridia bacterium]
MKATYVKTKLTSVVNVSKIVTIHYYEFDKNFVFGGESHDFWEMVYIDKGRVRIRADETETDLAQGEIIFHRPNEFHSIRALDSSPNFFVISFVSDSPIMQHLEKHHAVLDRHLKPYISTMISEAERTFVIPKNDPTLKKLRKKDAAPLGGEQLIKTTLEQMLILLIRSRMEAGQSAVFLSKESMENHLVKAVKQFIEEKIGEPFRVGDLCDAIGYSKSYLSKLFCEMTGETIASYATRAKIARAKEMIRDDSMNFTEISAALAFDNPQYFTRVFRRVTGMTPTEFKRSLDFEG